MVDHNHAIGLVCVVVLLVAPEVSAQSFALTSAEVGVVKNPLQQINYGTGRDVSDESVADAGEPLSIRWLAGSFVELPVRRSPR